ncbi:hypothetical protein EZV62_014683 [Acer yangbiense]|uniref:Cyclin N-terminal domain-containing protein n=1 Tax=Acer yangbiense TaxID=1000413 RepID=A0A5C7HSX6_9ROSI|nr:hypothetical protein EZV62_014683 [Acer yangbiense]
MAENLDCVASNLLCTETTNTCFDDLDCNDTNDVFWVSLSWHHKNNQNNIQHPNFDNNRSLMGLPLQTEERIREMIEKERDHLPKDDYLKRLRSGDLDLRVRRQALDWISKVASLLFFFFFFFKWHSFHFFACFVLFDLLIMPFYKLNLLFKWFCSVTWLWILSSMCSLILIDNANAHYKFGPLSFSLSVNYFDRFLSIYELPREKTWAVQLLAVACLSLAAKLEETEMPQLVDLQINGQVGEPKFVFEGKTIQRMELLILNTLKWRMQSCTPCSFIDYFLTKINDNQHPSATSISKSLQLILSTIKGIDFLEFKPSEIAAAVAISVSGDMQPQDIDKAMSLIHVEKERAMKCVELIKDLSLMNGCANVAANGSTTSSSVPQSPDGVLDAACLSYKSEDITVGSCANSSSHNIISSDIKRRKQERPPLSHEN